MTKPETRRSITRIVREWFAPGDPYRVILRNGHKPLLVGPTPGGFYQCPHCQTLIRKKGAK